MGIMRSAAIKPASSPVVPAPSALARILVIDDDEIACNTLSALSKAEGFDAVVARSFTAGVELLRRRHFRFVIADLVMPGMEGIPTLTALKEIDPNIEVIILTGHPTVNAAVTAFRQGACDFLQKPIGVEEFRSALMRAAKKRRRGETAPVDAQSREIIGTCREGTTLLEREGAIQDFTPVADQIKWAEAEMAERHRLATLVAEVGTALTEAESMGQGLQRCADVFVRIVNAAFARVWTTNDEEKVLELQASAGMYTHINGGHARVPIGKFKIGRIAESGEPHLTNLVREDPWVSDAEWARREGMVAFAGYPLKVEGRVLGVVAAFARQPLSDTTLQAFASVANNIALFIKRKRTEDALRLTQFSVEHASDSVFCMNPQGRIVYVNEAACRGLGRSREELLSLSLPDIDPNFPPEAWVAAWEKVKAVGSMTFETRHQSKQGRIYPVDVTANYLEFNGKEYSFSFARDITEHKRAEQQTRLQTAALEAAANGIVITDPKSKILWANPAFTSLTGYGAGEVAGQTPRVLKSGIHDESFYQKLWQTITAGEVWQGELVNRRKDGTLYTEEMTITPVSDCRGEITHFVAIKQDVTERKRVEEEVRESNERVRLLLDSIPEAVYGIDMQGNCTFCNPSCLRILGYQENVELIGKNMHALMHHTRQDGTPYPVEECHIYEAYRRGQGTHIDNEVIWRHDGSSFPAEYWSLPIYRNGNVIGTVVTFVDITERKRAEAALQESEERYRLLFSQMLVGFALLEVICDEQGTPVDHRYVDVNSAFEKHTGLARDIVVGRTLREALPGLEPFWIETYGKVATTGDSVHFESYAQPIQRWFEVTAFRLRPGRVAVTFADITQRRRAEAEIQTSEARYRELVENASDIVYTTDLETRLTSLNRVGQQTLGYSEAEATKLTLWQVVAPKYHEVVEQGRARLSVGERDITLEVGVIAKDGRPMELQVKPRLIYKDGKPVGVQGIGRDITGRDAAEMELRHAQKLESVGRLASGIAHEINTPIQFVGDNTRFLQDSFAGLQTLLTKYQELRDAADSSTVSPKLLEEVRKVEEKSDSAYLMEEIPKALAQTLDGVTRVATIVRAMKEFAHPEARDMAATDLNRALLSTLTVATNELKYVADVETDFADLPLVICNIGELNQVFLNLLVNAAHAIGEKVNGTGKKGKIRVQTVPEGAAVLVTISDTGSGIPEANRTKIFDPFFTTKEVGRGTGQGLAIARSVVVDRHEGALTFESEVGKGTTFYVRLPVDPGECSEKPRAA
jgi:PAS domain S-box-containing protein